MSRLEEALKRSAAAPATPEPGEGASAIALESFMDVDRTVDSAVSPSPEPVVSMPPVSEQETPGQPTPDAAFVEKLVLGGKIGSAAVEQYRRAAAILHHAQREHNVKVVMVASALPGEGKTLTSINLALTLSESYQRRVLLIDADLRRPMIHQVLGLKNRSGLNGILKALEERKASMSEVSKTLSVLTAGRPDPDPMSGLISDRMRHVLEEARERFEWVIIDTPPVALLPDANLLAAMVDAAVLVIGASSTPYPAVERAINALGRERITGVVLNRADLHTLHADYGYYGHYYGHYGQQA
jgi:capsular exopolysaccharide synthesis family protein